MNEAIDTARTTEYASPVLRYLLSQRSVRDLFLVVLTFLALGGVCDNEFVNFDDPVYVTNNFVNVQTGLGLEQTAWAFTSFRASNWHPLTWLSLQLDCEWFGVNASAFHRTNLLLHLLCVLILAEVLFRMTGQLWPSAAVAALFAVHPLHVESVAWVSERKDVLSTFFGMLAFAAYIPYARKPTWRGMALVLLALTASLLAKPMLVTFPCLLLLLDYWPLGRLRWGQHRDSARPEFPPRSALFLLAEKLPMVLLIVGSCLMTLLAQNAGGALKSLQRFPLDLRLSNALVSVATYLYQTFWPVNLGAYYPYPVAGFPWQVIAASAALLVLISAIALATSRSRPAILVGWLWFLGTLMPVIGLVQVGSQGHADRYAYIPHIGLFIMLVWGAKDLVPTSVQRWLLLPLLMAVLISLVLVTRIQVRYWHDSINLWKHSLAVTDNNPFGEVLYGVGLRDQGKLTEAMAAYEKAIRIDPTFAPAYAEMGEAYVELKQYDKALDSMAKAAALHPRFSQRLELLRRSQQKPE
jgi:protein O-mannosyl-transferase